MRLPDADGFIVAAQFALRNNDVVYLHNAEGECVAAVVDIEIWRNPDEYEGRHDHLEPDMGEEVPWAGVPPLDNQEGQT